MSVPTHRVIVVYSGRNLAIEEMIKTAAKQSHLKEATSSYSMLERQMEFVGNSREECDEFLGLLRLADIKLLRTLIGRLPQPELPEDDYLDDAAEE